MLKLTTLDGQKEVVFDNVDYVCNTLDLGKADITLMTYKGYNQIGEMVSNRTLETRDINIVGYILAESDEEMLQKKRFLQSVVGTFEDFLLIKNGFKLQVSATCTIEYATDWYINCGKLAKFVIEGTATNPCFSTLNEFIEPQGRWNPKFHFPHVFNNTHFAVQQPSMIMMVNNTGEIPIGMKIIFRIRAEGVSNPYMVNLITGEKLYFFGIQDLHAGDVIEVDTSYGKKTCTLNGETIDGFYPMYDADFLQLNVGENYLRYGAEGNEDYMDVNVVFTPQFFEV